MLACRLQNGILVSVVEDPRNNCSRGGARTRLRNRGSVCPFDGEEL